MQNFSSNNRHNDNYKSRLCFVGNTSVFSFTAFQTLLAQHVNISQVILAGYAPAARPIQHLPAPPISIANDAHSTIPALAAQQQIPVRYTGRDIQELVNRDDFPHHPPLDFLFVACFPFRLPTALREWPTKLAVNLHPSLLPAYRGPDPLFWQLQQGETHTGFSLHVLAEELDAGPVLFQQAVVFPTGASRKELDTLLAQQGTEAFCAQVLKPTSPTSAVNSTEQHPQFASYYPLPQAQDYALNTDWSAQRAYNFIRGTHTPIHGYPILLGDHQFHIESALDVEPDRTLGNSFAQFDNEILIQFSPGVLHAKPV